MATRRTIVLIKMSEVKHIVCLAHVRRKFDEALKGVNPKNGKRRRLLKDLISLGRFIKFKVKNAMEKALKKF